MKKITSTKIGGDGWRWVFHGIPVRGTEGNQVPDVDVVGVLPCNLATEPEACHDMHALTDL